MIGTSQKKLLFRKGCLELYVFSRRFWRLKAKTNLPAGIVLKESSSSEIRLEGNAYTESIAIRQDAEEKETYFERTITLAGNGSPLAEEVSLTYFQEGPLAEFSYASYKWMCRNGNLGAFPREEFAENFLGKETHNQLFYNYSGGIYLGHAWLDPGYDWVSVPEQKDQVWLTHTFRLKKTICPKTGERLVFRFVLFAGTGLEEHSGKLCNVLWHLNNGKIHVPQTDMQSFLNNYFSVWKKAELDGIEKKDHYAAHFFMNFYGHFKNGSYPPDQFGCSWIAYDLLKADYFCRLYDRTGKKEYLEQSRRLIHFYCYHHYIGKNRLTWPFHTGEFMKSCPPYCESSGWGAPIDPGYVDSLAQSEMIYDALIVYQKHPEIFTTDYPREILEDVLKLQQEDGHFRRRYNEDLQPEVKPGWPDQNAGSQSWIPTLLLLFELTGERKCFSAALACGKAALRDLDAKGMFALGGCETDYPTNWDVDGYRSMLRAMLALYHATDDPIWLNAAEKVQNLSSIMMMGYSVPLPEGTFYHRINWQCKGMVATSFYGHPDYVRSFSTPTGNQSVCWVAYLLLQLYRDTGKLIYAERGIAAMRQVMVYRDEESLKGNPCQENLLYTIFENNPQMSDFGGGYQAGVPQDGYSMFIDLYLYLDNILTEFGGIFLDMEREHVLGIDCIQILQCDFARKSLRAFNELDTDRTVQFKCNGKMAVPIAFKAGETREIHW
ncbi:MAG: hypothetical protein J5858_00835 [Lentisphaeria bacterium]|nr:hypothetical protein [Lentisphaeria bacterium]